MASTPAVSAARYAPSRRDRVVSFVLAVLVGVFLVFVLIVMSGVTGGGGADGGQLVAVNIAPPSAEKDKQKAAQRQDEKQEQVQTVTTPPPKLPPHIEIPSKNQVEWPPGFIKLSRDEIAKADISRIKPSGGSSGLSGAASGGAGAAEGNASGPGGARVYNAEWYREPYDSELSPYMGAARGQPGSWATIICHTVERFHVEDCREVDESPRGSGLARALRQAAWQFLVRPPRVDGKVMVGAWVSIRFTWREPKAATETAGQD